MKKQYKISFALLTIASATLVSLISVHSFKVEQGIELETTLKDNFDFVSPVRKANEVTEIENAESDPTDGEASEHISMTGYQIFKGDEEKKDIRFVAAVKLVENEGVFTTAGSYGFHIKFNSRNLYVPVDNFYNSIYSGSTLYKTERSENPNPGLSMADFIGSENSYTHFITLTIRNVTVEDSVFLVQSAYKSDAENSSWQDVASVKYTSYEKTSFLDSNEDFVIVNDNTENLKAYSTSSALTLAKGDEVSYYSNGEPTHTHTIYHAGTYTGSEFAGEEDPNRIPLEDTEYSISDFNANNPGIVASVNGNNLTFTLNNDVTLNGYLNCKDYETVTFAGNHTLTISSPTNDGLKVKNVTVNSGTSINIVGSSIDNEYSGISMYGTGNTINGNISIKNFFYGIYMEDTSTLTINGSLRMPKENDNYTIQQGIRSWDNGSNKRINVNEGAEVEIYASNYGIYKVKDVKNRGHLKITSGNVCIKDYKYFEIIDTGYLTFESQNDGITSAYDYGVITRFATSGNSTITKTGAAGSNTGICIKNRGKHNQTISGQSWAGGYFTIEEYPTKSGKWGEVLISNYQFGIGSWNGATFYDANRATFSNCSEDIHNG